MKVEWTIGDGYAGHRSHFIVEVPDTCIQRCESDVELKQLIEECVRNDFETRVFPKWDQEKGLKKAKSIVQILKKIGLTLKK